MDARIVGPDEVAAVYEAVASWWSLRCDPGAPAVPSLDYLIETAEGAENRIYALDDGGYVAAMIVRREDARITWLWADPGRYAELAGVLISRAQEDADATIWGVVTDEWMRGQLVEAGVAEVRGDMPQYDGAALGYVR